MKYVVYKDYTMFFCQESYSVECRMAANVKISALDLGLDPFVLLVLGF